jgi:hypothetical protein
MINITVYDFCWLCIEPSFQHICLYDTNLGTEVWEGLLTDIPEKYNRYYIVSWDPISSFSETLTLNISEEC